MAQIVIPGNEPRTPEFKLGLLSAILHIIM